MSTDPVAKLFYGYIQPEADKKIYDAIDHNVDDTPWSAIHTKKAYGCIGDIHGYDMHLRFFLAVEASLKEAEWDDIVPLTAKDFEIRPEWNQQLKEAAIVFNIDPTGLTPGWFLVSLWF